LRTEFRGSLTVSASEIRLPVSLIFQFGSAGGDFERTGKPCALPWPVEATGCAIHRNDDAVHAVRIGVVRGLPETAPRSSGTNEAGHFFEVEYTTAVKGLPHSKPLAFNRDVINPQDGHILCD
jgi:hypothetical protein